MSSSSEFPAQFIEELAAILESEATTEHYNFAGGVTHTIVGLFTGKWRLESLGFAPSNGHRRVIASFSGDGNVVNAVMDADDFADLVHGEHDPAFNSSTHSDLAYYVSILLMEHILTREPAAIPAGDLRIGSSV